MVNFRSKRGGGAAPSKSATGLLDIIYANIMPRKSLHVQFNDNKEFKIYLSNGTCPPERGICFLDP
jgi:hypothetical protein